MDEEVKSCSECRYLRLYPRGHRRFGRFYCAQAGMDESEPFDIEAATEEDNECGAAKPHEE